MSATSKIDQKASFSWGLGQETTPRPPDLKKGDLVELDCGYNGMIDMKTCRLLSDPAVDEPLFPGTPDTYSARVEIQGTGEVFTANLPIHHTPKKQAAPTAKAVNKPAKPRGIWVRFELEDWQKELVVREASERRGYDVDLRAALREYGLSLLT